MRRSVILLSVLFVLTSAVSAQVSVGIALPGVSIGINVPVYPQLVRVPGYPVYYAPGVQSNFFFYDGMYWVYRADNWYASSWYNGPWAMVAPQAVPSFVLRVPVRYYRDPPRYFGGWQRDAPPRWHEHWGPVWHQQRRDWDRWDHRAAPPPAPLPRYQRQYQGDRYPPPERQPALRGENYRFQPREEAVRQYYQRTAPGQAQRRSQGEQRYPHGKDKDRGGGQDHGQGKKN